MRNLRFTLILDRLSGVHSYDISTKSWEITRDILVTATADATVATGTY
jgi:hypothetical protein